MEKVGTGDVLRHLEENVQDATMPRDEQQAASVSGDLGEKAMKGERAAEASGALGAQRPAHRPRFRLGPDAPLAAGDAAAASQRQRTTTEQRHLRRRLDGDTCTDAETHSAPIRFSLAVVGAWPEELRKGGVCEWRRMRMNMVKR